MINHRTSLSIPEVEEILGKKRVEKEMKSFLGKFSKIKPEKAKEFKEKLESLGLLKMKGEHIVKIIDLLPQNKEELNKIFVSMSLDEDESKRVLDVIKEFA